MSELCLENVSLGYDGKTVISGLSFSVNKGDYLCIVGENGSGKSTLMKTLLHLNPPISGKITTGDGLCPSEIGYLPQQTEIQRDFPASVHEIVLSGCQNKCGLRPFYSKTDKKNAEKNMKRLDIESLKNRCFRELSGGQKQRVLLARALCATGKMLLLDEPVAGLDPVATAKMYKVISELNRDGISIIMVSHDISAALSFATHVLYVGNPTVFETKEMFLRDKRFSQFSLQKDGENS